MTAPYASAVVEAKLDWGNVDAEFEAQVRAATKKAAEAAQKNLEKIKLAAKVSLNPKVTEFRTETQKQLNKLNLTAKVEIEPEFGPDFRARVRAMAIARTGGGIPVEIVPEFPADFQARLTAIAIARHFRIPVDIDMDITAALAQLAALRAAAAGIGSGGGGFGVLGAGARGILNPIQLATYALVALSAVNLLPLIGQFAQAAGVISLLPAVAASAAAGIATIVIGSTGVFDAFKKGAKAADDAGKNAAATAKNQASAARQVQSAARGVENAQDGVARSERGVTQAQKQAEKAQEDLNRAREDAKDTIDDLNFALKGTAIDERDATLALARAREAYDETFRDPAASALDRSEAALNVDKAIRRQEEVGRRNTKLAEDAAAANKKGIEGSDQVVQAKEAVADANQGIVDAQKAVLGSQQQLADAQQGLLDAQAAAAEAATANATSVDAYAEALANLSPNARGFVEDIRGLGGAWKDLRLEVQDNLFDGLSTSIIDLANFAFPALKTGLGGIATEINLGFRRALFDLNNESTRLDWTKIFENTRAAIGPVIDGLSDLWDSLTNIAAIGSEFLPGFGQSFSQVMEEFRRWTESEEGENKIRDFMQKSITALREVKDLFVAVGSVIGGVFSTSEENGKSMIQSMTDGLNRFADWMKTPEGIDRMEKFWDDAQQTAKDMLTLVGEAIKLADKVSLITDSNFGLTKPGKEGGRAPNGQQLGSDGQPVFGKWTVGGSVLFPGFESNGWLGRLLGKDTTEYEQNNINDVPPMAGTQDAVDRLTVPSGGGRSAGQKVTREEWEALFGDVEEFDRLIAEQKAKQDELLTDSESRFVTFGNVVTGVLDGLTGGGFTRLKDGLTSVAEKILGTTDQGGIDWGNLGTKIGEVTTNVLTTIFPGFRLGLQGLQDFASTIVDGFGTAWDRLKELAAAPINFIIDHVINGALKSAWNGLAEILPGLEEWEGVARIETPDAGKAGGFGKPLQGMYTGGIIPGYTPGRDTDVIAVGGGEAVMRPEWTRAMGANYVNSMNAIARTQGVGGIRRHLGYFSNGGIVDNLQSIMAEKYPMLQMTSGLRYTDNGLHSKGMAADFSNAGIEGSPEMKSASQWWYENFGPDLLQLIHMPFNNNVLNGQNVGDGMGSPGYGEATMLDHRHHLHVGTDKILNGDGTSSPAEPGFLDRVKNMVGDAVGAGRNAIAGQARGIIAAPFDAAKSAMPDFGPSRFAQIPSMMLDRIRDAVTQKALGFIGAGGSSADAGNTPWDLGAGVEQWRSRVIAALQREGFDAGIRNQNLMLAQIGSESSGNPNAIQQVQDVNSGGNEAVGLLQVVPGTFAAHRNPDLPNDRTNPDASMSAALRYYRAKYGDDLGAMWGQGHGYDLGGIANGIGLMPKKILTPERVLSPEMTEDFERLVAVLERPDFIEILRKLDSKEATGAASAASAASGLGTPAPALAGAAAATGSPSTAFDPNNRGYDQSYYDDQIARGGVEGANAWLSRQDFASQGRTWGINAIKEIGGSFAEPLGLSGRWGQAVDWGAAEAMKASTTVPGGDTTIVNHFHGFQGTPQQMIAEWERSQHQRMAPVTSTYRGG